MIYRATYYKAGKIRSWTFAAFDYADAQDFVKVMQRCTGCMVDSVQPVRPVLRLKS